MKFDIGSWPTARRSRPLGGSPASPVARRLVMGVLSLAPLCAAPAWAQVALPPAASAPSVIWYEPFNAPGDPLDLSTYNTTLYSVDPNGQWQPGANACNGWVLTPGSAIPSDTGCSGGGGRIVTVPGTNPAGGTGTTVAPGTTVEAWSFLQGMTQALIDAYGTGPYPVTNAVASMTNGGSQAAGFQLQTESGFVATTGLATNPVYALQAGHYYALSTYFAVAHCKIDSQSTVPGTASWTDPSETLTLTLAGSGFPGGAKTFSATADPCVDSTPTASRITVGGVDVGYLRTNTLYSGTPQLIPAGGATVDSFSIYNSTAAYAGNDSAFAQPEVIDVTPQLYKSFNSDTVSDNAIVPGDTATLTLTVVNSTDYLAKAGWSFTDTLPAGVSYVSTTSSSCIGAGSDIQLTSPVVGNALNVTGDLAAGAANSICTLKVKVTAAATGIYQNGPAQFGASLNGVLSPNTATLFVNPGQVGMVKSVNQVTNVGTLDLDANGNPQISAAGEIVTYDIVVTNYGPGTATIGSPILDNAATGFNGNGAAPVFTCTPTTLAAGASATCTTPATQYAVVAADLSLTKLLNTAQVPITANGATNNISTTTVSTPVNPSMTISIAQSTSQLVAGQPMTYTITVTNTSGDPLTGVSVLDDASTGFTGTGALGTPACSGATLAAFPGPGNTITCTVTYTPTQTDVSNGSVVNIATATATDPARSSMSQSATSGLVRLTPSGNVAVPALDQRALALLALLLGGLAWLTQRKMWG